jgi:hypothetical protein
MLSATDGWAVGFGGTILHWNGAAWTLAPSTTTDWIWSVDMINASEGWAVGEERTHLHYVGGSWTAVPLSQRQYQNGVSLVTSNDGWSVGKRILHWNGVDWWETKWKTPAWLWGIKMLSRTQGWAVGYGGVILHYHPNLSVSGMVVDSAGQPLDDVNLSIVPGVAPAASGTSGGRNFLTNRNGRFLLEDLVEGTYTLTPSKVGYTFVPSSVTMDINFSQKYQNFIARDSVELERRHDPVRRRR